MRGLDFASDRASTVPYPLFCHCDREKKWFFIWPICKILFPLFTKNVFSTFYKKHDHRVQTRTGPLWGGAPLEGAHPWIAHVSAISVWLKNANGSNEKSRFWKAKVLQKFCVPILRTYRARTVQTQKTQNEDHRRTPQNTQALCEASVLFGFHVKTPFCKIGKSSILKMKIELQKWWW